MPKSRGIVVRFFAVQAIPGLRDRFIDSVSPEYHLVFTVFNEEKTMFQGNSRRHNESLAQYFRPNPPHVINFQLATLFLHIADIWMADSRVNRIHSCVLCVKYCRYHTSDLQRVAVNASGFRGDHQMVFNISSGATFEKRNFS